MIKPSLVVSTRPSLLSRNLRTAAAVSALSLLAFGAGCDPDDGGEVDSAAAELAVDASDSGAAESALLATSIDGIVLGALSATPSQVSAAINARISARFSPAGCATSSLSGAGLAITFKNCTGPRGLGKVDGTLTLSVTAATTSSISISAKATDLQLGQSTLTFDTAATYAMANGALTLTVDSTSSGVGPFGNEIEHTGDFTATWDTNCTSVQGDWSTSRDGRQRSIQVDVQRCAGSCATGTITRNTRDGRTITITLDGSVAAWTSTSGATGTFALRCAR
jgi:hypothetical protein